MQDLFHLAGTSSWYKCCIFGIKKKQFSLKRGPAILFLPHYIYRNSIEKNPIGGYCLRKSKLNQTTNIKKTEFTNNFTYKFWQINVFIFAKKCLVFSTLFSEWAPDLGGTEIFEGPIEGRG